MYSHMHVMSRIYARRAREVEVRSCDVEGEHCHVILALRNLSAKCLSLARGHDVMSACCGAS